METIVCGVFFLKKIRGVGIGDRTTLFLYEKLMFQPLTCDQVVCSNVTSDAWLTI